MILKIQEKHPFSIIKDILMLLPLWDFTWKSAPLKIICRNAIKIEFLLPKPWARPCTWWRHCCYCCCSRPRRLWFGSSAKKEKKINKFSNISVKRQLLYGMPYLLFHRAFPCSSHIYILHYLLPLRMSFRNFRKLIFHKKRTSLPICRPCWQRQRVAWWGCSRFRWAI